MCRIGGTWIGANNRTAQQDWLREISNDSDSEYIRWDDSQANKLQRNDLFAIVDARLGVQTAVMHIYRVASIVDRREQWANRYENAVQTNENRNGLLLVKVPLKTIRWADYRNSVNYSENYTLRGTTALKRSPLI